MKLVISPHADDEILGCYSVLLGGDCTIAFVSVNESNLENRPAKEKRMEEIDLVHEYKTNWFVMSDLSVNHYKVADCIPLIEGAINWVKPNEVYIPTPVSYNQDHVAVYQACKVALRPHDKNWFVPKVFVYEQPHTFLWPTGEFKSQYFRGLDIKAKLESYHLYETQVRSFRSDECITSIAKLRGEQSREYKYAESFQIERYIDEYI